MKTGARQVFNDINITPLTDIFLVLLIIMMVVAPMMQQARKDIKPPSLASGGPVEQNKLTVEVASGGEIYVQGQPTTPEQLTETLKTQEAQLVANTGGDQKSGEGEADQPAEKNLIIRADKATKSGQVLKIFEAARDAGFTKVTVAGEPLAAARQDELKQPDAAPDTSMAKPVPQGGA
ncbi:ExbD/TolR family protein [Vampirovibrio sp.]|uniref:ExbD/TolR family protein n=1 Tax=Vampirovibrio sp. TaxID=2717857 RepID=UPI00359380A7